MRDFDTPKKAVIYSRVSGTKQVKEGSGLDSQEHRCRQYAEAKGYQVMEVFPDDVSGGGDFMKRKGMVSLLAYLDTHPDENFVVIFDDLKRYSRDVEFHHKLRRHMEARNATRECLNFNFEDSPEGKLKETITVAAGEYERESNARQNWQKSIARLEQGYCVQAVPPVGYVYQKSKTGGKVLVKNEPHASIVKQALEGFATGHFSTQVEVKRFLEAHPEFPKRNGKGTLTEQTIVDMLRRHLYAGLVDGRAWGVSIREGQHEGIISVEVFNRIQEKLDKGVYLPARKDIAKDFPLRGAIKCCSCDTPLTSGWCKGKFKKYPYYFCRTKGCDLYGKTIPRKKIEGEFEAILAKLQPSKNLVEITAAMFKDCWDAQMKQAASIGNSLKRDILEIENRIEKLLDMTEESTNIRVLSRYEKRIEKLEHEKLELQEKQRNFAQSPGKFEELFELSIRFLSNPCKLWQTGRFDLQRLVLKLAFSEYLVYCRGNGFRTPQPTVPFGFLENFKLENEMVPGADLNRHKKHNEINV